MTNRDKIRAGLEIFEKYDKTCMHSDDVYVTVAIVGQSVHSEDHEDLCSLGWVRVEYFGEVFKLRQINYSILR